MIILTNTESVEKGEKREIKKGKKMRKKPKEIQYSGLTDTIKFGPHYRENKKMTILDAIETDIYLLAKLIRRQKIYIKAEVRNYLISEYDYYI
jgi:hypothetical protein